MMVSRQKVRGMIKGALSVTKKMFANEGFSVSKIRISPVKFPQMFSSPPAMRAGVEVRLAGSAWEAVRGLQRLASARGAYGLEQPSQIGCKTFGSQVGAIDSYGGSTVQVLI